MPNRSTKSFEADLSPADTISAFGEHAPLPSYLHGWRFLSVIRSADPEAIAFKVSAETEGPSITYNPSFVSQEDLESPKNAMLWLCSALSHIAHVVLLECIDAKDDIARFVSPDWEAFRAAASLHTTMTWSEIVAAARREGVGYISEHVAACLFAESGLQDRLLDRIEGTTALKIA